MRPLDLVADRLADIVQQAAAFGEHDITFELCRHQPGQMRHLDRVRKHILPIARTVAHASEQTNQLRMDAVNARLERRLLPRFLNPLIDLAARLLDHLFDACGMDAPVLDQLLKCNARNLAAHRIEPRKDDRFRRIVNDEINARQRLERADIASLASDDAALHLIVRQGNN